MKQTHRTNTAKPHRAAGSTAKTAAIATVTVVGTLIALSIALAAIVFVVMAGGRAIDSVKVGVPAPEKSSALVEQEWTPLQLEEKKRREAAKNSAPQLTPQQIQELRRIEFEKTAKPTP